MTTGLQMLRLWVAESCILLSMKLMSQRESDIWSVYYTHATKRTWEPYDCD